MSLGFTRLNVKKAPPNANIDFIKPLPGPNEAIAQDFLDRIAAQCFPVMKKNYLFVRSLEEYEPNREFVGRNFNAGEVVQLVLRSPTSGRWLPFEYVQMVMMHELAHCKQMNHSRAFWAVRNQYARQIEGLWAQGYTGEGIWGAGRELSSGAITRPTILAGEAVPDHLCGGTYRTNTSARSRKRKAPARSWKEQKERRILKKFGANGVAIGADDQIKEELEKRVGRKAVAVKPRVAGSARGRDLRAAAALARLEQNKKEKDTEVIELSDSDDDGDVEYVEVPDVPDALDIDGKRLTDKDGRGLIKVCDGAGNADDDDVKELASNEWAELLKRFQHMGSGTSASRTASGHLAPATAAPIKPTASYSNIESVKLIYFQVISATTIINNTDTKVPKPADKKDSYNSESGLHANVGFIFRATSTKFTGPRTRRDSGSGRGPEQGQGAEAAIFG
ncbi:hypothetical protein TD95_004647 [Thielaviopsis punctulata]|uniref:WLM domain-containing protein n=1 Tax=Thielaviopsis punctulata TaxID=72032 RepID=A0A0F4ZKN2_9PEZI|nr:hypothetical protein TD95_004647 [Thielaviopsis punctulata]